VLLLTASVPVQYQGLLTQDFEFGSDGMPLSPVTPELFRDALSRVSLSPSAVIARDEARHVEITVEEAVFVALGAGCVPAAAPVVIGAVRAWFVDADRRRTAGPDLAGTSHVVVVNAAWPAEVAERVLDRLPARRKGEWRRKSQALFSTSPAPRRATPLGRC